MNDQLNRLIQRQHEIWDRMQTIQRTAETENRDWTGEERANWDAANADLDAVSGDIERLRSAQQRELVQLPTNTPAPVEPARPTDEQRAEQYEEAFGSFMRRGMDRLTTEQRDLLMRHATDAPEIRAQGVGTNSAGGYLVPPGYRAVMTEAMKEYGGLINHANVITTSTGNPLQWPSNDDTSNVGSILAENSAVTELAVTLGTKSIGAFMYTSRLVLVSLQLLQDSAFDLDVWLPRKLGERIGRATAAHFISGTGSGQPEGIATNATASVTGAAGFGITYDNLIDLEHSIDPAYRANARFLLNDTTLSVIRKIKDSQGRPLWLPVPVPGMPATINGVPYTIDQSMAAPGANAKPILFGDFRAGYIVRQVLDIQMVRLAERYAENLQVGFFAFSRLDGKPDNTAAVRAFANGAT